MILILSRKPKVKIDQNKLARRVTLIEGKRKPISIAQVKEVQKILLGELRRELRDNPKGLMELLA